MILSAVRDGSCLLIVVFAQVQKCYEDNCATGPCMKDKVVKRLGTGFYHVAQMMVMMCTFALLYHNFKTTYPARFLHQAASAIGHVATLTFSAFRKIIPWNLRKAKHESCSCKGWCAACSSAVGLTCCIAACTNFTRYEKGPKEALDIILDALAPDADSEASEHNESYRHPMLSDPYFVDLTKLSRVQRRIKKETTLTYYQSR